MRVRLLSQDASVGLVPVFVLSASVGCWNFGTHRKSSILTPKHRSLIGFLFSSGVCSVVVVGCGGGQPLEPTGKAASEHQSKSKVCHWLSLGNAELLFWGTQIRAFF